MEFTTVVVIMPSAPAGGSPGTAPITAVHLPPAGARCFMANPQRGQLFQAPGGGRVLLVEQTLQRCSTQRHLNRRGSSEQAR